MTVEHLAETSDVQVCDGFVETRGTNMVVPARWHEENLKGLADLWTSVARNLHAFESFGKTGCKNKLLKLHGSLGWFVVEEGTGDIGDRDELRYNSAFGYFRFPHDTFWKPEIKDKIGTVGLRSLIEYGQLKRKAGAIWLQPYLGFARNLKVRPDLLSISIVAEFVRLLEKARNILVVGYSWGDAHVNDLILDAVARGASLINVSNKPELPALVSILRQRFATTYPQLRKRIFPLGGGARKVLQSKKVLSFGNKKPL